MDKPPTLQEAKAWFQNTVIPMRTTSSGFSGNRLWKTPLAIVRGNSDDPNGLCGDAALFVCEEYYRQFKDYATSDGFTVGMILWEGVIENHMANIMLSPSLKTKEKLEYNKSNKTLISKISGHVYQYGAIAQLTIFDLYYKKTADVGGWWTERDNLKGTITTGQEFQFA